MKTLRRKKLLITKDQYEDKSLSSHKMQASPYHEEEYWKRKKAKEKKPSSGLGKLNIEELLTAIKNHEDK